MRKMPTVVRNDKIFLTSWRLRLKWATELPKRHVNNTASDLQKKEESSRRKAARWVLAMSSHRGIVHTHVVRSTKEHGLLHILLLYRVPTSLLANPDYYFNVHVCSHISCQRHKLPKSYTEGPCDVVASWHCTQACRAINQGAWPFTYSFTL